LIPEKCLQLLRHIEDLDDLELPSVANAAELQIRITPDDVGASCHVKRSGTM
jgi:hypothetical protein